MALPREVKSSLFSSVSVLLGRGGNSDLQLWSWDKWKWRGLILHTATLLDLGICLEFLAISCHFQQQRSVCLYPEAVKCRPNKLDSDWFFAWALSSFACKVLSLSLLGCIINATFSQVTSCSVHHVYCRKTADDTSFADLFWASYLVSGKNHFLLFWVLKGRNMSISLSQWREIYGGSTWMLEQVRNVKAFWKEKRSYHIVPPPKSCMNRLNWM